MTIISERKSERERETPFFGRGGIDDDVHYIGRIGAIRVNEKERGYRKHGASRHRLKV